MPMNPEQLRRLRELVRSLQPQPGQGLPHHEIASLAQAVEGMGSVTIDYRAAEDLGHPMVVLREASGSDASIEGLTRRELEVAALVAQGLSNKEIARSLSISLATTKDHVHRILEKTGLPNRAAVAAAVRS